MTESSPQKILLTPLKPALIEGLPQKLPVLIRLQAPVAPPSTSTPRLPYHLALVIDRSGSMHGEPLHEAVRCVRHIVDQLKATDCAALVVFDDRADVLVQTGPVGDRSALYRALASIHTGGQTNLHGGWKAGMEALASFASTSALARVILLSDGNANIGETTVPDEIAARCAAASTEGISTSTYGLGLAFNEELMVGMASQAGGNHYYGEKASDLFEPFAEEFDLISNLYARNVRLSLACPPGIRMKVLNDYRVLSTEGFATILLPDIPYGGESWLLVDLEISAESATSAKQFALQAAVTASTPDGTPLSFLDTQLTLQAVSPAAWEALLPDERVLARQAELAAAAILTTARAAAALGDWEGIDHLLRLARQRFADHPWVIEILTNLASLAQSQDNASFLKETLYSARKLNTRIAATDETANNLTDDANIPRFLRRNSAQGRNPPEPPRPDKPV